MQAKSRRLNSQYDGLIGSSEIKNFIGISEGDWTKRMFITSSFFNNYACKEIEENEKARNIEWYDRYSLIKLLNQLIPETMLKFQLLKTLPENRIICPSCGKGILVERYNSKDHKKFLACSLYCGYTRSKKR